MLKLFFDNDTNEVVLEELEDELLNTVEKELMDCLIIANVHST